MTNGNPPFSRVRNWYRVGSNWCRPYVHVEALGHCIRAVEGQLEQIAAEHGCLDHETNTSETPIKLGFETSIIAASLMEDSKRCLQSTKRASLYRTTETCCNGHTISERTANRRLRSDGATHETFVQSSAMLWIRMDFNGDFNGLQRTSTELELTDVLTRTGNQGLCMPSNHLATYGHRGRAHTILRGCSLTSMATLCCKITVQQASCGTS
jgi:hypothetical protein